MEGNAQFHFVGFSDFCRQVDRNVAIKLLQCGGQIKYHSPCINLFIIHPTKCIATAIVTMLPGNYKWCHVNKTALNKRSEMSTVLEESSLFEVTSSSSTAKFLKPKAL